MKSHTISFKNAFFGIWVAIKTQLNLRIHFFLGSIVLISAVYLNIPLDHVLILLLTIALVLVAELFNTAVESVSDAVTISHNPQIKIAKDVSAGAVLIASIFAVLIGLIIFIPPIMVIL